MNGDTVINVYVSGTKPPRVRVHDEELGAAEKASREHLEDKLGSTRARLKGREAVVEEQAHSLSCGHLKHTVACYSEQINRLKDRLSEQRALVCDMLVLLQALEAEVKRLELL